MRALNTTTLEHVIVNFPEFKHGDLLPYGFTCGEEVILTNVKGDTLKATIISYADDYFKVRLPYGLVVAVYKTTVSKEVQ